LLAEANTMFPLPPELNGNNLNSVKPEEVEERLVGISEAVYQQREKEFGAQNMRILERMVMLRIVDSLWVEHLTNMEERRLEAAWQTLRQVKAVDAYKNMGSEQFQILSDTIRHDVAHTIYHVAIRQEAPRQTAKQPAPSPMAQVVGARAGNRTQPQGGQGKVGRNDPCPCGSGKKYKHCHGK
jgi:preprotein translocase subunit SecA